ncbi:Rieske (2Fe-2S) protein [Aureimonas ureilytica]|uniref:Rieske (2Fe-2S) protein n=1 Tax=Aureimonas ureilytica TaxID=401562 RepID=UPI003CF9B271
MTKHVVARVEDLPSGSSLRVLAHGRAIALFNVDGAYYGIADACPHQGGPLSAGVTVGLTLSDTPGRYSHSNCRLMVRCPWHAWEFDLTTGRSVCDPRTMRVRAFALDVVPGEAVEESLLRAETFEVSVDGQYLVVEI